MTTPMEGATPPDGYDAEASGCPMGGRRAVRSGEPTDHVTELRSRTWLVRTASTAQALLRARQQTTQAGFTAEFIPQGHFTHRPILISDGPQHDEQRRAVARFFAPAVVERRYAAQMRECAERLVTQAALAQGGASDGVDVAELALLYTVEVTADVVGLTHGRPGTARSRRAIRRMAHRLESFFRQPPFDLELPDLGRTPRQWAQAAINGLLPVVRFHLADVLPAVRQRRRRPQDDVLSHLIGQGYSVPELLVESVTYGTAGMVTTREFICMALWHLLTDDALRADYEDAVRRDDADRRIAVLTELIRLEPVVGHLYRRASTDIVVDDRSANRGDASGSEGSTSTVRAGELVDIVVRATNTDPAAFGPDADLLCPGRRVAPGQSAAGLSFGDGVHKCPGQPLALLETDILLQALLARRPRLLAEPTISWDDLIAGYQVRGLRVCLDQCTDHRSDPTHPEESS